MLEHLPCVRIDPAPFRPPQPISGNVDERDIRFELERQACQSLRQGGIPVVLQLKLQQRRTRDELVDQGIMPPLKSSAAFLEQRQSLERARTEDYLKKKIKSRPEKSELIRMHILEETSVEPLLQAKQLQLKKARLADDLNDKLAHRPGPMELIHKNILPVHSSIKQAIIETQFQKASGENSSCDEDSNDSQCPGQSVSQECPLASPTETRAGNRIPSPTQVPHQTPLPTISRSSSPLKLTNGTVTSSVQRMAANSHTKPKTNSDHSAQKQKKAKDNKPKIKKLKYHQYIPPDQKGDKEPPPHLDSSYAKILQQQQLFLQLQILSQQQQQHYNYHTILPAPPKPQADQQSSSSPSSPPRPAVVPSTILSNQHNHTCVSSAALRGTKPVSLPANLDEMKVTELKSELKLRSLPLSGTKNDLIERLRAYQELNGGSDTTSSPTAGGTTGPGAEGAGKSSRTAATTNDNTSQPQQPQYHQTSSLTADAGSGATPTTAAPQQLMTCSGTVAPLPVPLTPSHCSLKAMSSEDTSFNSSPLEELRSSPLTQLSFESSSTAQLSIHIKEEPSCFTPAPCPFSLKSASLQKHGLISSAARTTATTVPVETIDKDRMLQEKDKQIEELTRMVRQKQRLVELLKMQLESGNQEGRVSEPLILLRVKEEPPDKPAVSLSTGHPPFPPVTIKEEAIEEGAEAPAEKTVQSSDAHGLLHPSSQTQEVQEQVQLKPEQKSTQSKQELVCLQQLAQQQAIQKVLLQQQQQQQQHRVQKQRQATQNPDQKLESHQNLQKLCQQRKKKSQKLQLKQQQEQNQLLQSQQQHQQTRRLQHLQLKQQILLKQQKSLLQQQVKQQQQTKQMQQTQIQTNIHMNQQQVLIKQKQEVQQQSPQVSQVYFNQQSVSARSFPLDLLKHDSTPTLVSDSNGNHFLIALTNHIPGNQRNSASEGKATNHITLQRLQSKLPGHSPVQLTGTDNKTKQGMHMGFLKQQNTKIQNAGFQVSVQQQQEGAAQSLSAPPTLQPFFKDQACVPLSKNTSSPSSRTEMCPELDVLFSPPSPASVQTADSSPDDKDSEHEEDFIDTILQTGEMSTTFKSAPDHSLDHLKPNYSASSPPPSPLHLLLSPTFPPRCDSPQPSSSELETLTATIAEKQHFSPAGSGRLEDFLESTTGKPLLGVEPGGLLTLIDDLHSQMLCTPSILDHPPSPMDTFDMAAEEEQGVDSMDWLDFTFEGEKDEKTSTLTPLGPQSPPSVFSTDFLDSYDPQIHWDSCL